MAESRGKTVERVGFLDEVRGFAILCMVVYHAAYDLVSLFHINIPVFYSPWLNAVRDIFAGVFILISGMVSRFSRSNIRRGFWCLCLGLLLTAVTWLVLPAERIIFGILHLLGICMLLFGLLQKWMDRIPAGVGVGAFGLLFIAGYGLPHGYIGVLGVPLISLPASWYETDWLFWLGLHGESFFSSDYFPLIPWGLLFMAGTYIGIYLRRKCLPTFFYRTHCRFLAACGRHTLWIYLIHQPVLLGIFWLIGEVFM